MTELHMERKKEKNKTHWLPERGLSGSSASLIGEGKP